MFFIIRVVNLEILKSKNGNTHIIFLNSGQKISRKKIIQKGIKIIFKNQVLSFKKIAKYLIFKH